LVNIGGKVANPLLWVNKGEHSHLFVKKWGWGKLKGLLFVG
tara:strand:+ start:479 stop:601 length:123 start_codon:yes stop_codon:yes gene_type:complete